MKTLEEQLDELLAMAKDLGEAETELAAYERTRDTHGVRTSAGATARRHIPMCRRRVEWCKARLASARRRFLGHQTESSTTEQP